MLMTKAAKRVFLHCARASTLLITIPDEHGGDSADFVFDRVLIDTDPTYLKADKQIHVTVKQTIHESDRSIVYLGAIKGKLVVLKCCYCMGCSRDIEIEVRVYKKRLGELQGRIVSVCYGYYLGKEENRGPYSLLLLEYCGQSLSTLFEDLSIEKRYAVHVLRSCVPFRLLLPFLFQSVTGLRFSTFLERSITTVDCTYLISTREMLSNAIEIID